MRTTLTLEPDLARRLKELAHRRRSSFKETVNDVLRRGLTVQDASARRGPRFSVEPHEGGFRPGIDPGKLNQLLDQLDAEDLLPEVSTTRRRR